MNRLTMNRPTTNRQPQNGLALVALIVEVATFGAVSAFMIAGLTGFTAITLA